jgi:hypothetical protein
MGACSIPQLPLTSDTIGLTCIAAHLQETPEELSERLGIKFEWTSGPPGLGDMLAALCISNAGDQFLLFRYEDALRTDYTAVLIHEKKDVTRILSDILVMLNIHTSNVIDFSPEFRFQEYEILRQDDCGNCMVAATEQCLSDAIIRIGKFEELGHKQTYVIREATAK